MHGRLIDEIGYHCRDYFLGSGTGSGDYPGGILAHSTHVKGLGTLRSRTRGESPRIHVTLATGIARDAASGSTSATATRRRSTWRSGGRAMSTLVVPRAGEMLYRVGPAHA